MDKVKALVLCGGKGTRLRPITHYIQKTMIPIGHTQRPLLEYMVQLLKFHKITEIAFLVDYKAEQIQNYFDNGARFDVKIRYVFDDKSLQGTGGSIINAYNHGVFNAEDTVLVCYGDIITNINLEDLLGVHKKNYAFVTIALSSGFTVRVSLANLETDGRIRKFVEKPQLEKPVGIGILALEGRTLKDIQESVENQKTLDLMGDLIPYLLRIDRLIYGFVSDAFWYDVGSIEAYEKLDKKKVKEAMSFLFEDP